MHLYSSTRFRQIRKIENLLIRNFFLNIWIFLAKKNKSFSYYFFSNQNNSDIIKKNYIFLNVKPDKDLDEKVFLSLKENGIIILHRNKAVDEKLPNYFSVLDERVYGISKIVFGKLLS